MKIIFVSRNFESKRADLSQCDPEEMIMMIDVDRCISCGSCELACQIEHRKNMGNPGSYMPIFARFENGQRIKSIIYHPLSCRHCESPCDYYSPYNYWINCPDQEIKDRKLGDGEIISCDLCVERTRKGLWPACATRCTMKTIFFGAAKDMVFALGEKRLSEMGDVDIPV